MLKKILTSPAGIAGILILSFGVLLGTRYDPNCYKQQDSFGTFNPRQAARIAVENNRKQADKEEELIFIWGSIGFGLLMLGNAAWRSAQSGKDNDPDNTNRNVNRD